MTMCYVCAAATSYYVKLKIDDGLSWESALAERDAARQAMMAEGATREQALKVRRRMAQN